MSEDADAGLVRRFVAGDEDAFDRLVRRHEVRVYNIAYRMVGRAEDAKDVTQEAFLTAFRKLPSFRGDSAFSTWMHRVTLNACHDLLRKRKRGPVPFGDETDPGPPAGDHADRVASALDVQRALLQVPEDFRAVLVLHDVQGHPYEEIASALEIPVGTVKSRLHRGRVALGALLAGTPEAAGPSEGMKRP
ncbi:MAG: sigma-70 family RNA polymerase sigma factor [Actinomycetota bacterium]